MIYTLFLMLLMQTSRAEEPVHLTWANIFISDVEPEYNVYDTSPYFIAWEGVNGATHNAARTVCSTFLNLLFMQSYTLSTSDLKRWTGSSSPKAERWYDTIASQKHFESIETIDAVSPGDMLAIKYLEEDASSSGHVGIIAAVPTFRMATIPIIDDTVQYEVVIIDSSRSGHGSFDTRRQEDGSYSGGIGQGIMRIYTDEDGYFTGYTWSTYKSSVYYGQDIHPFVIGKVVGG